MSIKTETKCSEQKRKVDGEKSSWKWEIVGNQIKWNLRKKIMNTILELRDEEFNEQTCNIIAAMNLIFFKLIILPAVNSPMCYSYTHNTWKIIGRAHNRYDPSRVESFSRSSNLWKFNEPGNWQVTNWTNWLICSLLSQLIMALHRYRRGHNADFKGSNPEHPSIHIGTVISVRFL